MIIGFDAFVNKVLKESGERCKEVVYATYGGKILIIFLLYMFYTSFSFNMVLFSQYRMFFLVLYILVSFFIFFMLATRRVGFGMNDSRFVYVKFKHINYKAREAYDIMFENIKYLDVKRFLGVTSVKMSFIDGTGRLKRLNFKYLPFVLGLSKDTQKKSGQKIYEKLIELQKVLDRGDF